MKLKYGLLTAIMALLAIYVSAGEDFPLDLSRNANMDFKDDVAGDGRGGWSDQGPENDLRGFDVSRKDFGGMSFQIVDPAKNNGRAVMTFDSQYARTGLTEAVFELSGRHPARFLYLLHTSCWNQEPNGTPIGTVKILFEDGSSIEKQVRAGIEVADWWNAGSGPNSMVVYKKTNNSRHVGIFLSKFELGGKDGSVKSVLFKSNGKAVWIVLGATLSSRELDNKDKPVLFTENNEWKIIDMSDIQVKAGTALDLSSISEPGPAGKHGRAVISKSGRLAFEDSPDVQRRLFGFNGFFHEIRKLEGSDRKTTAQRIAQYARLVKRQGYDIVRPLVMDMYLMEGSTSANGKFNPEKLDNIDRLIAEFKNNGVYTYLTIGAYRLGMKDPWDFSIERKTGNYMTRMYIGEEIIRSNWKTVAVNMLNHVNPYTGLAWKDDPAIACVEFYNEQEIGMNRLASLQPELKALFNSRWRAWLLRKYKTPEAVAAVWADKSFAAPGAFEKLEIPDETGSSRIQANDFGLFFRDLAREEMAWCEDIVRGTGYNGLISQFNFSKQILDSAVRWETSEVVSTNYYYCHPTEFSKGGSRCSQTSSAGEAASYWRDCNSTRFADRPLFITEHNHAFWNKYQHEDGLIFAAYSALQGFSEVTVHEDAVSLKVTGPNIDFSIASSPVGRANEFVAACLFRRGDVKEAARSVELQIPVQYLNFNLNGKKAVGSEQSKIALMTGFSISFPGLKRPSTLKSEIPRPDITILPDGGADIKTGEWSSSVVGSNGSRFSIQNFVSGLKTKGILPASNISDPAAGVFQSETGEITLRTKENLIKVVTAGTEGVSLEDGRAENLACLKVEGSSVPASVSVISIDGNPVASSSRLVLVYNTEVANSGMALSEDRVTMRELGKLPVLMRTGRLKAVLKCKNASKMSLYALRIDGTRREKLRVSVEGDSLKLEIDSAALKDGPTPFFELIAE